MARKPLALYEAYECLSRGGDASPCEDCPLPGSRRPKLAICVDQHVWKSSMHCDGTSRGKNYGASLELAYELRWYHDCLSGALSGCRFYLRQGLT